jgi:dipeptidyl aminopeptidase/acylaminoacyl peptidase
MSSKVVAAVAFWAAIAVPAQAAGETSAPIVLEPAGAAKATVVLIHGGGWKSHGAEPTAAIAQEAGERVARWGFRAVSIDYAPGRDGLGDVLRELDEVHRRWPRSRVCVAGESAGGHWALMAAARRSWVRCVVATAAPTDLATPRVVAPWSYLGKTAAELFAGVEREYSPLFDADRIGARVLLAYSTLDLAVPFAQGAAMQRALGERAELLAMPPGAITWMHSATTAEALTQYWRAMRRWLSADAR